MKLKQAIMGIAAATAGIATVHAQTAGSFFAATGWFHFAPQDHGDPLMIDSINGMPVHASQAGTGSSVSSSDTLGFSAGYFITDHIAAETDLGIPPRFDLNGAAAFSQFGKLGSARQWSPALVLKYYFRAAQARFRPYAGIGVTYVWFTDAHITNGAFEQGVLHGPTSVATDRSWAPVFNVGFNYAFTKHWFAGFSVSYIPVGVTAKLTTQAASPGGGTQTVVSEAKMRLDPIVTFLHVGYQF